VGYARHLDAVEYESVTTPVGVVVYRERAEFARFPRGWRVITDRMGRIRAVVGMSARPVTGTLAAQGMSLELTVAGNDRVNLGSGERTAIGVVSQQ